MKVEAIKQAIVYFKDHLDSKKAHQYQFLYEVADRLQTSFNSEESYIKAIESGMKSDITQRLWKRHRYEPKENLLLIAQHSPEYFNKAISDLLDESKELANRIDRFKFYCDELLRTYKADHKHSTLNHHYVDESFISLILMGKYPLRHAYYDHALFIAICEHTAARPIPEVNDYPRYLKIAQIINNFIVKDEELLALIKNRDRDHLNVTNLAVECMAISCNIDLTA